MIRLKAIPFLQIDWKHQYYTNKRMRNLQIMPTQQTNQLMRKMGIFFKASPSDMRLAYSQKTLDYMEGLTQSTQFIFTLKNSDPYFQNITDLPLFNPNEWLFYFDNLPKEGKTIEEAGKEEPFVSEKDLVQIGYPLFDITFDGKIVNLIIPQVVTPILKDGDGETATLRSNSKKEVELTADVTKIVITNPKKEIIEQYDLKKEIEEKGNKFVLTITILNSKEKVIGKYTLIKPKTPEVPAVAEKLERIAFKVQEGLPDRLEVAIEGEEPIPFYAFPSFQNQVFGMLHLYVDLDMLTQQGEAPIIKWQYEIKFHNRATCWRYYFLTTKVTELPDFTFTHPTKDTNHTISEELKILSNGSKAWEVTFDEKIPLRESYANNENEHEYFSLATPPIKLPNANPTTTRGVQEGAGVTMYSDAYIYFETTKNYKKITVPL